jgi:hypothetical protein
MNARHSGLRSGAAPATAMTHIAVVEQAEEDSTGWMEKVSDEQYQGD